MVGCWVQRAICAGRVVFSAALVAGCTQVIRNDPINQPLTANARQVEAELSSDVQTNYDDMVVALSFSGGGMRAAAFSYGVLTGFEETRVPTRSGVVPLLDRLDFLSGVSGGSTLAAYYGLYGRAGIADFKQRFLLVNAEEGLTTNLSLGNIARGLQGGVNDTTQFPVWLDNHLYNHATFKNLLARQRPRSLDQCLRHLQSHGIHLRAGIVQRAVQRSDELSRFARGCRLRGGAGRLRSDRHSKLPGRLPGCAAGLGRTRAQQPKCRAFAEGVCRRA